MKFSPFSALVAGGLALAATGAAAETMHANYKVSLIGLPIGVAVANSAIEANSYRVDLNVRLTGLAAMVSNLKMALASSGAIEDGAPSPAAYATTASNSRETRTLRMSLDSGRVRQIQYYPEWDDAKNPERVQLTEAHKRDILDPLSAFVIPVAGADTVGASVCNRRTVPVFDGYTRFDITLEYAGVQQVKSPGYNGAVTVCHARYHPVAGHKPNAKATQFMANNDKMEVWLAPMPHQKIVVPYRVSLMTMAGTAVIEASELSFKP